MEGRFATGDLLGWLREALDGVLWDFEDRDVAVDGFSGDVGEGPALGVADAC